MHRDMLFEIMRDVQLEGGIGLLQLLCTCEAFDTTDPLDRVYALRALTVHEDVT